MTVTLHFIPRISKGWICYISFAVLAQVQYINGNNCRITSIKSTNAEYGNVYDTYGNSYCCGNYYPILYSIAKCSYVSLSPGQRLEDFIYDSPTINENVNLKYFMFDNSHITTVSVALFSNFANTSITTLFMNATSIATIQPGAFTGLSKLQELQLGENDITELTRGALNYLTQLITLNMSYNHIDVIEKNALLGLFSLQNLILNHNKLKTLSSNAFPGLTSLRFVDLSYNIIPNISDNLFDNISNNEDVEVGRNFELNFAFNDINSINLDHIPLETTLLNLAYNKISDFESFNLPHLQQLDISNNNISSISKINSPLSYLNLSANRIDAFIINLFEYSEELHYVDLSHNLIHAIHEDVFDNLTNLYELHLQNNQLDNIPIGCFRQLSSLITLNLSGNTITEFEYGTFSGLGNLTTLDISNNTLTFLYESTLHPLISLNNLYVDHNLLTTFDPYDFLQHLKALKTISLNFNPWNCKSLLNIFTEFKSRGITVTEGSLKKVVNVNGIACYNYKLDYSTSSTVNFTSSNNSNENNIPPLINDFQALNKFFNKDFFNSGFYKYFQNYSNLNFQEPFLDQFQKMMISILNRHLKDSSISNSTFIENLNDTVSQLIKEFKFLHDKTINSSVHETGDLTKNFLKYIDVELKNSTFYKYLNEDFLKLDSIKQIFKNASDFTDFNLSKLSTQFNSLRSFFNEEFEKSTFYKFFKNENALKSLPNYAAGGDFKARFEKLTDEAQPVLNKISNLQNNLNVLLVIVIIILCGLFMLHVFKNCDQPISRFMNRKSVLTEQQANSRANLELI